MLDGPTPLWLSRLEGGREAGERLRSELRYRLLWISRKILT